MAMVFNPGLHNTLVDQQSAQKIQERDIIGTHSRLAGHGREKGSLVSANHVFIAVTSVFSGFNHIHQDVSTRAA